MKLAAETKELIEAEKVLSEFRINLLKSKKNCIPLFINNTREELVKIKMNVSKKRMEIPGADAIIEYIDEVLIAGLEGYIVFKQ